MIICIGPDCQMQRLPRLPYALSDVLMVLLVISFYADLPLGSTVSMPLVDGGSAHCTTACSSRC